MKKLLAVVLLTAQSLVAFETEKYIDKDFPVYMEKQPRPTNSSSFPLDGRPVATVSSFITTSKRAS
jgi:hypothetical protein